jgi:hypothetical protein
MTERRRPDDGRPRKWRFDAWRHRLRALPRPVAIFLAVPAAAIIAICSVYAAITAVAIAVRLLALVLPAPVDRGIAAFVVAPIVSFYASLPIVRISLRLFPIRIEGKRRVGCLVVLVIVLLMFGVFYYVLIGLMSVTAQDGASYTPFAAIGCEIGVAASMIAIVYWRSTRALKKPFLLYLRRFSSFADREVASIVLRNRPIDLPVAMLVSTRGSSADWNPFILGFSGLKLSHPIASIPIYLASGEAWEGAVRTMVQEARAIIIDLSEMSSAVVSEVAMISSAGKWPTSICLAEASSNVTDNKLPRDIIVYRRTYRAALLRISLSAILFGAVFLSLFNDSFDDFITKYYFGGVLGMEFGDATQLSPARITHDWFFVLSAVSGLLFYIILLAKPLLFERSLDASSRSQIKLALSGLTSLQAGSK